MTSDFSHLFLDIDERLFGFDGDELLVDELNTMVERWCDNYMPEPGEVIDQDAPAEIVEWSVQPALKFLPSAAEIIYHIDEAACSSGAGGDDCPFEGAEKDPDIVAAAEALRAAMSKFCSWTWADQELARHQITVVDGQVHIDGEQFYKPKESS